MKENHQGIRFRLRHIFVVMAIGAVAAFIPRLLHDKYYWQLHHVESVLSAYPEIEDIIISGNHDAFFEVERLEFRIAGKAGSRVVLAVPHQSRIDGGEELRLARIGSMRFTTSGSGFVGTTDVDNGEPVRTNFIHHWIDIGSQGVLASKMPFEANTIGRIIDNYDKMIAILSRFPRKNDPGTARSRCGMLLHYYVERVPN